MEIIPAIEITISKVCEFLKNSNIRYRLDGEDSVFIEGHGMQIWLEVDAARRDLIFSSYWSFQSDTDEVEKLILINDLNSRLRAVQFSYELDNNRVIGSYYLSYRDGLMHVQIMRAAARFAKVFNIEAPDLDSDGLLDAYEDEVTIN